MGMRGLGGEAKIRRREGYCVLVLAPVSPALAGAFLERLFLVNVSSTIHQLLLRRRPRPGLFARAHGRVSQKNNVVLRLANGLMQSFLNNVRPRVASEATNRVYIAWQIFISRAVPL